MQLHYYVHMRSLLPLPNWASPFFNKKNLLWVEPRSSRLLSVTEYTVVIGRSATLPKARTFLIDIFKLFHTLSAGVKRQPHLEKSMGKLGIEPGVAG